MNISIYISDEKLIKSLQAKANKENRSLSYFITKILTEYINKEKKNENN